MQLRPLTLACALALPLSAHAQADTARAARDLDEVVVTATRTPVSANAVLAPVEVIDRDMIVRSQARSLPELLRGRAGVAISNQGGPGKLTTLFMRGAESDHVLVLVDGVRIGSATSGLVSFQDLPLSMIDRVEIVRGPRSSLYGSEAIGGAINFITQAPAKVPLARLQLETSNRGYKRSDFSFSSSSGKFSSSRHVSPFGPRPNFGGSRITPS